MRAGLRTPSDHCQRVFGSLFLGGQLPFRAVARPLHHATPCNTPSSRMQRERVALTLVVQNLPDYRRESTEQKWPLVS
jgi:hypothetical protein